MLAAQVEDMKKTFDVLYYRNPKDEGRQYSHKYSEPWEKTEFHCPRCGNQEVWFCNNGGNYYLGEQHICTNCKASFYLPNGVTDAAGEQDEQRLENLTANALSSRAAFGVGCLYWLWLCSLLWQGNADTMTSQLQPPVLTAMQNGCTYFLLP